VYGHDGDYNGMRTGATTEEFVGDITRTITGNVTDDITGDISETFTGTKIERTHNISGDVTEMVMAAGKIELNTTAGTEISSIEMVPSKKATITGEESLIRGANESSIILGQKSEAMVGMVNTVFSGLKTETFFAGQITIGKAADITKRSTQLTKISNSVEKAQNKLIDAGVNIIKAKLTMIG